MNLISSVPALAASASAHYDTWQRAVNEFVARRINKSSNSLDPVAVGRATLARCRAPYEQWAVRADEDLTVYLDAASTPWPQDLPTMCSVREENTPLAPGWPDRPVVPRRIPRIIPQIFEGVHGAGGHDGDAGTRAATQLRTG